MRSISLDIPDFNTLNLSEKEDSQDNYINLNITLSNDELDFNDENSPFIKYVMPIYSGGKVINIRLWLNDKTKKELDYIFITPEELTELTGTITPLQYKIKIIQALALFDD